MDEPERRLARERMTILEALIRASENMEQIASIVGAVEGRGHGRSNDEDALVLQVAALLGTTPAGANSVVNSPLRMLTPAQASRYRRELDELQNALNGGQGGG